MIHPAIEHRIKELLATGKFSQRKIARMTGAGRGTVGLIANGRRPDQTARYQAAIARNNPPFSGLPEHCPECGRLVHLPCLACSLARDKAAGHLQPPKLIPDDHGLHLELSEEHRARYEAAKRAHVLPEKEEGDA